MHSIENLIYAAYEAANDEAHRPHLGASILGKPCDRATWYVFRWALRKKFDGRMLRLFETGQLEESRFTANLRAIGAEVHETAPDGSQWRVTDLGGHFGGSMDGAATNVPGFGKQWLVVEYKTHSEKSFTKLVKERVQVAKPEHYVQMQIYMGETGMERALYVAKNKNTDEIYTEKVKFDPVEFAKQRARAERIITWSEPPAKLSTDPSWYQCKFCDFHSLCFGETLPEVNCRTCMHSTPEMDGDARWSCASHKADIPLDAQRTGCEKHRYIPILLHWIGQPKDVVGDNVVYETPHGDFQQGEGANAISSTELRAMEHKVGITGAIALKAELASVGISGKIVK